LWRIILVTIALLTSLSLATGSAEAASLHAKTPKVSGHAQVGQTLTAKPGSWRPRGVSFTYKWLRNGRPILGATAQTYTLTAADQGAAISVKVIGSRAKYKPKSKTSKRTSKVKAGQITTATPTITGVVAVGRTLAVTPGAWQPSGLSFSYEWKVAGVTAATGGSWTVPASALGKTITVTATATKTGYLTSSRTSSASSPVASGSLTGSVPTISGTAQVGAALTATPGSWGPSPVSLAYQWIRSGTPIAGATGSSYSLSSADQGKQLTVSVTGSKTGYSPLTKTGGPSGVVQAAPPTGVFGTVMARTQRMSDANLTSSQAGWYEASARLQLSCYKHGQSVKGYYSGSVGNGGWDDIWYQVSDGYFVADIDINTGSNSPVTGACAAPPAGFRLPFAKGTRYQITQGPAEHAAGAYPDYNRNAVDFATPVGTPVLASASGTVSFEGYDSTGAIQVRIDHGNNRCSQYVHLSKTIINKGQQVAQGQKIGESGNTGISSGPHLHWNMVYCSGTNAEKSLETINTVEMGTSYPVGWSAYSQNG
jgi:hypothetical protein